MPRRTSYLWHPEDKPTAEILPSQSGGKPRLHALPDSTGPYPSDIQGGAKMKQASKLSEDDDGFVPESDGFRSEPGAENKADASAGTTGVLHALSGLSMVGLPNVLGAVDTLRGRQSEVSVDRPDLRPGDQNFDKRSLVERFYKNREFYQRGMDRGAETSPKAALAGDLAPMLIPGPAGKGKAASTIGRLAFRGAVQGGTHELFRGDAKTLEGDVAGTALDVVKGAGAGAAANVGGGLIGKGVEKVGTAVGGKLRGDILEKAKSLIGRYRQQKQEASSASEKAALHDAMEHVKGLLRRAEVDQGGRLTRVERAVTPAGKVLREAPDNLVKDLQEGAAGNLERVQSRFLDNQAKFGKRGVPGVKQAKALAEQQLQSESQGIVKPVLKALVGGSVGAAGGGEIAALAGFDRSTGRLLGAGVAAKSILSNPKVMKAIGNTFPQLGRKLATMGGNAAEAAVQRLMEEGDFRSTVEAAQSEDDDGFTPESPSKLRED